MNAGSTKILLKRNQSPLCGTRPTQFFIIAIHKFNVTAFPDPNRSSIASFIEPALTLLSVAVSVRSLNRICGVRGLQTRCSAIARRHQNNAPASVPSCHADIGSRKRRPPEDTRQPAHSGARPNPMKRNSRWCCGDCRTGVLDQRRLNIRDSTSMASSTIF